MPTVLLSLALVSFGANLALADVPGTGGTITACYHKNSGDLRVIETEAGESCRGPEVQLTWSDGQTGKVADSDLLDGIDSTQLILHCPSGYTRSRDVCFSARTPTGNFYDAWFACLNSGARLPDTAELAQIFPALVVAGGVPAEGDWAADMTTAGTAMLSVSVGIRREVGEFGIADYPGVAPVPGADRFPVAYVSPRDSNRTVLGLDLGSQPGRRRALEAAFETVVPS